MSSPTTGAGRLTTTYGGPSPLGSTSNARKEEEERLVKRLLAGELIHTQDATGNERIHLMMMGKKELEAQRAEKAAGKKASSPTVKSSPTSFVAAPPPVPASNQDLNRSQVFEKEEKMSSLQEAVEKEKIRRKVIGAMVKAMDAKKRFQDRTGSTDAQDKDAKDEAFYFAYEKLQEQQQEIEAAKKEMAGEHFEGNLPAIQLLLKEAVPSDTEAKTLGDLETYQRVQTMMENLLIRRIPAQDDPEKTNSPQYLHLLKHRLSEAREHINDLRMKVKELTSALKVASVESKSAQQLLQERNDDAVRMKNTIAVLQRQLKNLATRPGNGQPVTGSTAMGGGTSSKDEILRDYELLRQEYQDLADVNVLLEKEIKLLRIRAAFGGQARAESPAGGGGAVPGSRRRDRRSRTVGGENRSGGSDNGGSFGRGGQIQMVDDAMSASMHDMGMGGQTSAVMVKLMDAKRSLMRKLESTERGAMAAHDFNANNAGKAFGAKGIMQPVKKKVEETPDTPPPSSSSKNRSQGPSVKSAAALSSASKPAEETTASHDTPISTKTDPGPDTADHHHHPTNSNTTTTGGPAPQLIAAANKTFEQGKCWLALCKKVASSVAIGRADVLRREDLHLKKQRQRTAMLAAELNSTISDRDAMAEKLARLSSELMETKSQLIDTQTQFQQAIALKTDALFGAPSEDDGSVGGYSRLGSMNYSHAFGSMKRGGGNAATPPPQQDLLEWLKTAMSDRVKEREEQGVEADPHEAQIESLVAVFNRKIDRLEMELKQRDQVIEDLALKKTRARPTSEEASRPVAPSGPPVPDDPDAARIRKLGRENMKKDELLLNKDKELRLMDVRLEIAESQITESRLVANLGLTADQAARMALPLRQWVDAAKTVVKSLQSRAALSEDDGGKRSPNSPVRKNNASRDGGFMRHNIQDVVEEQHDVELALLTDMMALTTDGEQRQIIAQLISQLEVELAHGTENAAYSVSKEGESLQEEDQDDVENTSISNEKELAMLSKRKVEMAFTDRQWFLLRGRWVHLLETREQAVLEAKSAVTRRAAIQRLTDTYAAFFQFEQLDTSENRPPMCRDAAMRAISLAAAPITIDAVSKPEDVDAEYIALKELMKSRVAQQMAMETERDELLAQATKQLAPGNVAKRVMGGATADFIVIHHVGTAPGCSDEDPAECAGQVALAYGLTNPQLIRTTFSALVRQSWAAAVAASPSVAAPSNSKSSIDRVLCHRNRLYVPISTMSALQAAADCPGGSIVIRHLLQPNDTLSSLALQFSTSTKSICLPYSVEAVSPATLVALVNGSAGAQQGSSSVVAAVDIIVKSYIAAPCMRISAGVLDRPYSQPIDTVFGVLPSGVPIPAVVLAFSTTEYDLALHNLPLNRGEVITVPFIITEFLVSRIPVLLTGGRLANKQKVRTSDTPQSIADRQGVDPTRVIFNNSTTGADPLVAISRSGGGSAGSSSVAGSRIPTMPNSASVKREVPPVGLNPDFLIQSPPTPGFLSPRLGGAGSPLTGVASGTAFILAESLSDLALDPVTANAVKSAFLSMPDGMSFLGVSGGDRKPSLNTPNLENKSFGSSSAGAGGKSGKDESLQGLVGDGSPLHMPLSRISRMKQSRMTSDNSAAGMPSSLSSAKSRAKQRAALNLALAELETAKIASKKGGRRDSLSEPPTSRNGSAAVAAGGVTPDVKSSGVSRTMSLVKPSREDPPVGEFVHMVSGQERLVALATRHGMLREFLTVPNFVQLQMSVGLHWLVRLRSMRQLQQVRQLGLPIHAVVPIFGEEIFSVAKACGTSTEFLKLMNAELTFESEREPVYGHIRVPLMNNGRSLQELLQRSGQFYTTIHDNAGNGTISLRDPQAPKDSPTLISGNDLMDLVTNLIAAEPEDVQPFDVNLDAAVTPRVIIASSRAALLDAKEYRLTVTLALDAVDVTHLAAQDMMKVHVLLAQDLLGFASCLGSNGGDDGDASDPGKIVKAVVMGIDPQRLARVVFIATGGNRVLSSLLAAMIEDGTSATLEKTTDFITSQTTAMEETRARKVAIAVVDSKMHAYTDLSDIVEQSVNACSIAAVRTDDTLATIALRHGLGVSALLALNPIVAKCFLELSPVFDSQPGVLAGATELHISGSRENATAVQSGESIEAFIRRVQQLEFDTQQIQALTPNLVKQWNTESILLYPMVKSIRVPLGSVALTPNSTVLTIRTTQQETLLALATRLGAPLDRIFTSALLEAPVGAPLNIQCYTGVVWPDGRVILPQPFGAVHAVEVGESEISIAKKYDLFVAEIRFANAGMLRVPKDALVTVVQTRAREAGDGDNSSLNNATMTRMYYMRHIVQPSDTLSSISALYLQPIGTVLQMNARLMEVPGSHCILAPVSAPDAIESMMLLNASNTYVIVRLGGDSLATVAKRFSVPTEKVAEATDLLQDPKLAMVPLMSAAAATLARQRALQIFTGLTIAGAETTMASIAERFGVTPRDLMIVGKKLQSLGVAYVDVPLTYQVAKNLLSNVATAALRGQIYFRGDKLPSETIRDVIAEIGGGSLAEAKVLVSVDGKAFDIPLSNVSELDQLKVREQRRQQQRQELAKKSTQINQALRELVARNEVTQRELEKVEFIREQQQNLLAASQRNFTASMVVQSSVANPTASPHATAFKAEETTKASQLFNTSTIGVQVEPNDFVPSIGGSAPSSPTLPVVKKNNGTQTKLQNDQIVQMEETINRSTTAINLSEAKAEEALRDKQVLTTRFAALEESFKKMESKINESTSQLTKKESTIKSLEAKLQAAQEKPPVSPTVPIPAITTVPSMVLSPRPPSGSKSVATRGTATVDEKANREAQVTPIDCNDHSMQTSAQASRPDSVAVPGSRLSPSVATALNSSRPSSHATAERAATLATKANEETAKLISEQALAVQTTRKNLLGCQKLATGGIATIRKDLEALKSQIRKLTAAMFKQVVGSVRDLERQAQMAASERSQEPASPVTIATTTANVASKVISQGSSAAVRNRVAPTALPTGPTATATLGGKHKDPLQAKKDDPSAPEPLPIEVTPPQGANAKGEVMSPMVPASPVVLTRKPSIEKPITQLVDDMVNLGRSDSATSLKPDKEMDDHEWVTKRLSEAVFESVAEHRGTTGQAIIAAATPTLATTSQRPLSTTAAQGSGAANTTSSLPILLTTKPQSQDTTAMRENAVKKALTGTSVPTPPSSARSTPPAEGRSFLSLVSGEKKPAESPAAKAATSAVEKKGEDPKPGAAPASKPTAPPTLVDVRGDLVNLMQNARASNHEAEAIAKIAEAPKGTPDATPGLPTPTPTAISKRDSGVAVEPPSAPILPEKLEELVPMVAVIDQLQGQRLMSAEQLSAVEAVRKKDEKLRREQVAIQYKKLNAQLKMKRMLEIIENTDNPQEKEALIQVTLLWRRWLDKWNTRRRQIIIERRMNIQTLMSIFISEDHATSLAAAAASQPGTIGGSNAHGRYMYLFGNAYNRGIAVLRPHRPGSKLLPILMTPVAYSEAPSSGHFSGAKF